MESVWTKDPRPRRKLKAQNGWCVLLQTPGAPAHRWAGVCRLCERFHQVFLDKGLGISDPPRPPEINLQRERPQT